MRISYYISKILKKIHIPAIKNSNIHHTSKVGSFSHMLNVKMNKYSYVANYCTLVDTDIGCFCSIADNVIIGGGAHPIDWVSTSPVFHDGKNFMKKNFSKHSYIPTEQTIIKNDVWIGSNCLIKSGVTIENGAIIGMGSVVTKNVGSYEIWAGNPAKIIRKRFDDTTIKNLLSIKWWNWNSGKLENNAQFMNNIPEFIKLHKSKKMRE